MTKWNKVEVALNCKPIYFWRLYLPQVFSFYIFHNLELGTGHNNPHSIDDLKIDETNHFFDFHYVLWVKDHITVQMKLRRCIIVLLTLFFYKPDFLKWSATWSLRTDEMTRTPSSSQGCYEWTPITFWKKS